jgi:hypothetical protein
MFMCVSCEKDRCELMIGSAIRHLFPFTEKYIVCDNTMWDQAYEMG